MLDVIVYRYFFRLGDGELNLIFSFDILEWIVSAFTRPFQVTFYNNYFILLRQVIEELIKILNGVFEHDVYELMTDWKVHITIEIYEQI